LTGYAEQIQRSLPTGSSAMETAEHREPYESRGSRTDVCPVKAGMFSRGQTCRGRSQSPVVWIAEEMETEPSKPIGMPQRISALRRRPHHFHQPRRALRLYSETNSIVLPRQIHARRAADSAEKPRGGTDWTTALPATAVFGRLTMTSLVT
jgi:hypothetical protein